MRLTLTPALLACLLLIAQPLAATSQPLDRIVAIVNDDVITQTELDHEITAIRQQQRGQELRLPSDSVLSRQVLERLINKRIQLQMAKNTGITIDDESLNNALRGIARQNNMNLGEFHDTLTREGIDFENFRENLRDELTFRRLRQRHVDSLITVSDQEIANFMDSQRRQGESLEEYHLGHILIALPEAATSDQIQAARQKAEAVRQEILDGLDFQQAASSYSDGQQALDGGDLGWRKGAELPTLFASQVLAMKPGGMSDVIRSPSGFHLVKLLGIRNSERHIIEQTRARHILIKADELTTDSQARDRINRLRERIEQGDDFAALAKQYSQDKVSAARGGSLGWVSPGEMVPDFEAAMDKLQPGQVSQAVKTRFGWHLIEVLERRKHDDTETFNRNHARQMIFQRKSEENYLVWLRRLRSEAYVKEMLTPQQP